MPNYNAILILEAIAAAPIPDDIKLQAVKDIRRMYEDKEYGERCGINLFALPECVCHFLPTHHYWRESFLGVKFWINMYSIISQ